MIRTPRFRANAITGSIFRASAATRSAAPEHQWRSHMSQMTSAVFEGSRSRATGTAFHSPLPFTTSTRVRRVSCGGFTARRAAETVRRTIVTRVRVNAIKRYHDARYVITPSVRAGIPKTSTAPLHLLVRPPHSAQRRKLRLWFEADECSLPAPTVSYALLVCLTLGWNTP